MRRAMRRGARPNAAYLARARGRGRSGRVCAARRRWARTGFGSVWAVAHLRGGAGGRLPGLSLRGHQDVAQEEAVGLERGAVLRQQSDVRLGVQQSTRGAQHRQVAAQPVHQSRPRAGWQAGEVAARECERVPPRRQPAWNAPGECKELADQLSLCHARRLVLNQRGRHACGTLRHARQSAHTDTSRTLHQRLSLFSAHGAHVQGWLPARGQLQVAQLSRHHKLSHCADGGDSLWECGLSRTMHNSSVVL